MPNPPNNNDLQREKVRFLNDSLSLKRIITQGSIANSSRDNVVVPFIPATPSPTASVTPTPSVTSTVTPTITLTPTQTSTVTPTLTITSTPTVTPTITITPTISITPTVTPTITITPSVTPDYSYITLQTLTAVNQDVFINGLTFSDVESNVDLRFNNGLYRVTSLNQNDFTQIVKYQLDSNSSFLVGVCATEFFNWKLYNLDTTFFKSPDDLGSALLIPFSGYQQIDGYLPYYAISGVKVYPDYKFSSLFARTTAVSAVIIRGLTGTAFNDTLSTVNGLVLNRAPSLDNQYEGFNLFYNVTLYYFTDFVLNKNYWILDITPNTDYNTFSMGFTGSANFTSFLLPFTGLQMSSEYLSDETNFRILSGQINQPNLQLLNANELFQVFPTPTPTPTLTPTPTITPTISLTPTITPTITITPSITPTITPTESVTPTITPTITVTPTVSRSFDPDAIYTGTSTIYVRGISGTYPYDPAPELSGSYSFISGFTYFNNNTILDEYKFYLRFNALIWPEDVPGWEFFSQSDSGDFQRAYYPWSDRSVIPNTTGWLIGTNGYGIQEDYNYMIITKN